MNNEAACSMLTQDDDCHWFIIPEAKEQEWFDWLETDSADNGDIPDWALPIDGPHRISFPTYQLRTRK